MFTHERHLGEQRARAPTHASLAPLQVLIPVFALGRAQELCILLETFWWVQRAASGSPGLSGR